ncbi:MAG TPA: dihydrofolate reductase family protein [Candidatus Limnocylindrales bacterium]|nr:dihydrofolate reductase family protein [Candidatus Limnocylindrales bacterium]
MRLVVVEFMTLDGVMEAPGFEEHRSGRNGWAMRADDPELAAFNGRQIHGADALLFGRTTFNVWAAYWPTAPGPAAPMAVHINRLPKYVVSKSLQSTDWANTTILHEDLGEDVRRIKDLPGGDLMVYGSADLVGGLLELDLVDELRIALFPVILGSGKRLFREDADLRQLRLVASRTTSGGIVLLTYRRTDATPEVTDALQPYLWTPDQVETYRVLEETNRVLATVLFTDIVDSTGRAAALGDREWRRILDRHDEAARAEIRRWGGEYVKSTGDGALARFDAPTRAVRAAIAIAGAARRLGVEIRAAIHTGEVEVRGTDLGGIGVHIASRVLAVADAGQVVVTRTVRDLAIGTDLRFESRGSVTLRGVPGEWELFTATI